MKVALIATGDEVVSGQIINTNSSFLASKLSAVGIEVDVHLAVLDKEESLKETLEFLSQKKSVDVVLTIGGLGPTRDDVTRKVVSEYAKKELIINNEIWSDMKCGLIKRKIKPRKGHKWQAFFPEGAEVLKNSKGTAQAFLTEAKAFTLICLPGPPSELESVLDDGLLEWFEKRVGASNKLVTWQCINIPESELAHEIEEALEGCEFQVGYRASPPITEVKLWVDETDKNSCKWIAKVDEVCKSTLYSKNGFSYINEILDSIQELYLVDKVTEGFALQEIQRSVIKKNFKKIRYAYGEGFKSDSDSMVFYKNDDEYTLEYKKRKYDFSLKGKNVFRSKKAGIYALLEIFKMISLDKDVH